MLKINKEKKSIRTEEKTAKETRKQWDKASECTNYNISLWYKESVIYKIEYKSVIVIVCSDKWATREEFYFMKDDKFVA